MKKLILTLDYPPQKGGVAVYLENLAKLINTDDIFVVAPKYTRSDDFDLAQPYRIERVDLLYRYFWPHWLKAYFITKKLANKHKVDYLIISHLLPMGYVALALGLPYTVIIHGMDVLSAKQSLWKLWWAKTILSRAKMVVANSNYTKIQALNICKDIQLIEVAYPCPADLQSPRFDQAKMDTIKEKYKLSTKKVILSVNRLVSRKGNDTVIKSLPQIIKNVPDVLYIIIGNGGNQSKLEELIGEFNLQKNVLILNNVENSELQYFYSLAKVFVMPSRLENGNDVEGFGIVYLEAALYGVPSIGTNTGGIPEAIIDKVTGLIIEPDDIDELSRLIKDLFIDQIKRNLLGANAKNRAVNEFQWSKQFAKVIQILK